VSARSPIVKRRIWFAAEKHAAEPERLKQADALESSRDTLAELTAPEEEQL
jgi:hypothetical protein